jgi:hypothetical protein
MSAKECVYRECFFKKKYTSESFCVGMKREESEIEVEMRKKEASKMRKREESELEGVKHRGLLTYTTYLLS